ncbi:MAG: hypothetical protein KGH84_00095 [Paracoccaceae bacterium]|nr:hypothetical protein [Paracoccaceae bacterium]
MKPHICVLGASHVGAIRAAWLQSDAAARPYTLDFFAAPNRHFARLDVQDGALSAITKVGRTAFTQTCGRDRLVLSDYDALLIVGCGMSVLGAVSLYSRVRFLALPSMLKASVRQLSRAILVSRPCFLQALTDRIADTEASGIARLLHQSTPAQIMVASQPRPSAAVLEGEGRFRGLRGVQRRGDAGDLSDIFDQAATDALHGLATYLPQPIRSIEQGLFTRRTYTVGALRLGNQNNPVQPHEVDDHFHGNAAYGALVLEQIARALT